jgi:MoxR-like ATPase
MTFDTIEYPARGATPFAFQRPAAMDDQLIGRERERARLEAAVREALAGRGSLVLLAGEAGVGKTTLARRAGRRRHARAGGLRRP